MFGSRLNGWVTLALPVLAFFIGYGKQTPEQTKEMQYRRLARKIWEKELRRAKDELIQISLGKQFMTIKTNAKEIDIHRSLFEDYIAVGYGESRTIHLERIKKYLEQLL